MITIFFYYNAPLNSVILFLLYDFKYLIFSPPTSHICHIGMEVSPRILNIEDLLWNSSKNNTTKSN